MKKILTIAIFIVSISFQVHAGQPWCGVAPVPDTSIHQFYFGTDTISPYDLNVQLYLDANGNLEHESDEQTLLWQDQLDVIAGVDAYGETQISPGYFCFEFVADFTTADPTEYCSVCFYYDGSTSIQESKSSKNIQIRNNRELFNATDSNLQCSITTVDGKWIQRNLRLASQQSYELDYSGVVAVTCLDEQHHVFKTKALILNER